MRMKRKLFSGQRHQVTAHQKATTTFLPPANKKKQRITKEKRSINLHQHASEHFPSPDYGASEEMVRTPDLRDYKSHAERLPTLRSQSVQIQRLLRLLRLRGTGVHFCFLAQICTSGLLARQASVLCLTLLLRFWCRCWQSTGGDEAGLLVTAITQIQMR